MVKLQKMSGKLEEEKGTTGERRRASNRFGMGVVLKSDLRAIIPHCGKKGPRGKRRGKERE